MIIAFAAVASVIIAFGRDKSSAAINFASNLAAGENLSIPENPDWQKELGSLRPVSAASAAPAESASSTETLTDLASKSLISNYLALKRAGTLDQDSAQKLVDQTASYIEKTQTKKITKSNLNIIADNGRKTIAEYGEALGLILRNNKSDSKENELAILEEVMSERDPQKMALLETAADAYKKIADEMKAMPVPDTFVKAHLDMVNGLLGLSDGLLEIQKTFNDPFRGLEGIKTYQAGGSLFVQAIQASSEFIKKNNIIYKQGSGGYYLLYGI